MDNVAIYRVQSKAMGNPYASWFDPDKLIKDIIWQDLCAVRAYAKGKLLDVGCGEKQYQSLFCHVDEYIGIDKKSLAADIRKDFLTVRLPSSSFDTVLCTQVLEHVSSPQTVLKKIHTLLKPKGVLILTVPFVYAIHEEPHDYFRFSRFALQTMLRDAGFVHVFIKEEGNFMVTIGTLFACYLEFSFNRYFFRYPKKVFIGLLLLFTKAVSKFPERFSEKSLCPMNYLVVARKK